MFKRKSILRLTGILLLSGCLQLMAQNRDIVPKPERPRLVNDFANMLTSGEVRSLEQKLVQFDSETSTQVAVVTVKDLNGYDVVDYATRIMEEWGVGTAGKNNGVVIVLKPKTADSRGQAAIAAGYGLEGLIPDALAKRIVELEMIPEFQKGNIYGGLNKATLTIIGLTKGEFTGSQYLKKAGKNGSRGNGIGGIVFFIIVFVVLPSIFGANRRNNTKGFGGKRSSSLPFWLLLGMMGSRGGSGSFGGFSGGGGSGGFGGFGGGMGGGGGAGGSW